MADQYPYSYNYKKDPLASFMDAFAKSAEKMLMYSYQKRMEDDSTAKRLAMERQYQEERQKETQRILEASPEYQRKAQDNAAFDALPPELQQRKRMIDWKLEAPPEAQKKTPLQSIMEMINSRQGGMNYAPSGKPSEAMSSLFGVPGSQDFTPLQQTANENATLRAGLVKEDVPADVAESVLPKTLQEQKTGNINRRTKMENEFSQKQQLADMTAAREEEVGVADIMKGNPLLSKEMATAAFRKKKSEGLMPKGESGEERKYRNAFDVELAAAQGDPEAKQLLENLDKRESDKADASYVGFSPLAKTTLAKAAARGIKPPEFPPTGMGAKGTALKRELVEAWAEEVNALPGGLDEYSENRVMQKAIGTAVQKQEMNLSFTSSYVANLGKQVKRVTSEYLPALKRVDASVLNKPISWWETHVPGSADEAIVSMYVKEISSEIARLSAGSALSIAMIPEGNRQEWERVHDKTLPVKYLDKVLKETHHAGTMRLDSLRTEAKVLREMARTNDWDAPHSGDMEASDWEAPKPGGKYDGGKMFGVPPKSQPKSPSAPQAGVPKEGDLFDGVDPTSKQPVKAKFIGGKWIRVQ